MFPEKNIEVDRAGCELVELLIILGQAQNDNARVTQSLSKGYAGLNDFPDHFETVSHPFSRLNSLISTVWVLR